MKETRRILNYWGVGSKHPDSDDEEDGEKSNLEINF
jgi:hypothetical protein